MYIRNMKVASYSKAKKRKKLFTMKDIGNTKNGGAENIGKWNKLQTSEVYENDTMIVYIASTPGFSPFAISAEKIVATPTATPTPLVTMTPTPTATTGPPELGPTPTKGAPGFEIKLIIGALFAAIICIKGGKSK